MKSVNEAQAETPELNPNSMSALSPLHEWEKIGSKGSYRLPDSLCNGAVKLFGLVPIVVCLCRMLAARFDTAANRRR